MINIDELIEEVEVFQQIKELLALNSEIRVIMPEDAECNFTIKTDIGDYKRKSFEEAVGFAWESECGYRRDK